MFALVLFLSASVPRLCNVIHTIIYSRAYRVYLYYWVQQYWV